MVVKVPEDFGSDYGSIEDEDLLLTESDHPQNLKRNASHIEDQPQSTKKLKTEPFPDPVPMARSILQNIWGFSSFRLQQEAAIAHLISGSNAAVIFPTGGGKSLVYQVPALAFDQYDEICGRPPGRGVTLVVSPLIALMKDQVDALKKRGVAVAATDSSQSRESWLDTCEQLRNDQLRLLYIAPEKLNNEAFVAMIHHLKIRLVAVDEAHCISSWGHSFRPDYLKVARFVKEIGAERVLCLTATATPQVADDIRNAFDIDPAGLFRTTSFRPNLSLRAQSFKNEQQKFSALREFLHKNKGPTIVYVQTHNQTDSVSTRLKAEGLNAYSYHAGMATDARTTLQDKFLVSQNIIIVATIAFGMGIDKPDIRNIVHFAIPKSLEGYSQEIGRAGRDGLPSICLVFLCAEDIGIMEQWSRGDVPSFRTVKGLVGELIEVYQDYKPGDVIERNLNEETSEWDIRRTALDLLNAQLELRMELIRAITPKYSKYTYSKASEHSAVIADGSKVAEAIRSASKVAKVLFTVDVDAIARSGQVSREDAVRKLQEWNDAGAINLKPSGVVSRFRVLKPFPRGDEAKNVVFSLIYKQIEEKEREAMGRIQDVINFVTKKACLSRELARHFGDEGSVPEDGCGNCEFCLTKKPVSFVRGGSHKGLVDDKKVQAILSACRIRDDARLLARIGFGISSPRITKEKLGKHEVFGSMADCDFEELVQTFSKFCDPE